MPHFLRRARSGAGLLLIACTAPAWAGSFMTLDDAHDGYVGAMSRDGHVVNGSYVAFGSYAGSFVWRQGEGVSASPLVAAGGMNSWGQPSVGSAPDAGGNQVAAMAYSDVGSTGPVLIGAFPGSAPVDSFYSQAYGMSDDGIAVGLAYDPSGNPIAFRWSAADGMTRLAVERPETFSRANGISASGHVIFGWNDRDDGYRTGVIWIDGVPLALHNPGPYGDAFGSPPGEPLAATRDGSVVVGQGYWDDLMQSQAWRWTLADGVQPIGVLVPPAGNHGRPFAHSQFPAGERAAAQHAAPSGFFTPTASYAVAVSDDGNTIVGNTGIAPNQVDAFIWTPQTGMVWLSAYAAAHGITLPPGFLLYSGSAISGDGLTIAGTGVDASNTVMPWLMDLHDAAPHDTIVTAQGSIASNNLSGGPFSGFPVGASVTLRFHLKPAGTSVTPAHRSDYTLRPASFALDAHYVDPNDYSHHDAHETLAPGGTLLHVTNDAPHADGVALDTSALGTAGYTLDFAAADSSGTLFDSDLLAPGSYGFDASRFDSNTFRVSHGAEQLGVTLEFVTLAPDLDGIFTDGFDDGN